MLKDLGALIDECRANYQVLEHKGDVQISGDFKQRLAAVLLDEGTYEIWPYSVTETNSKGLVAHYPSAWLWYGCCYHPFSKALDEYKRALEAFQIELKEVHKWSTTEVDRSLNKLPPKQGSSIDSKTNELLIKADNFIGQEDKVFFRKFLTEREWWLKPVVTSGQVPGRSLDRNDVFLSAKLLAMGVVAANSDRLPSLVSWFIKDPLLEQLLRSIPCTAIDAPGLSESPASSSKLGQNTVYYGAPGTGKSREVNLQVLDCNTIRTIFHTDTQNSDFVGCLKPRMEGTSIQYEFRAGPFTKAVIAAVNNPESHHWLVIEEINRAAAAAVFGEVFQLLDRDSHGRSEYGISLADEDMAEYIKQHASTAIIDGKLWLPSNLSLLATMNSSDQAVMPLDTAFKRRWQFEYIALDFDKACAEGHLPLVDASGMPAKISWKDFALAVNSVLSENNFPEDRHLGPFFITDNELTEGLKTLTGKLCLYLWDDVLRHGRSELLFSSEIKTYGQLVSNAHSGNRIFSEALYRKFQSGAIRSIRESDDVATNDDASLVTEEALSAVAEPPAVYGNEDD